MIHELSLSEYVDTGHTVAKEARGGTISWSARLDPSGVVFRSSQRNLGPFDCDCAVCMPMKRWEPMGGANKGTPRPDDGQLEIWP